MLMTLRWGKGLQAQEKLAQVSAMALNVRNEPLVMRR